MMRAAGFNVVRMGEFAWDRMEPEEGRYDFSLFDETIARLADHGISTIFCTPTATPPRWLSVKHPDIVTVSEDGHVNQHGSRRHACMANPHLREHSRRITRALAEHFRDNPAVIGWQTDNEIYCHFNECHCPACQSAFVEYLRRVFDDDIDSLNHAFGTAFWSQTYTRFEDVPTPKPQKPAAPNPSHLLEYHRFVAQTAAIFQHEQVEILRAAQPRWWVTGNHLFAHTDLRGLMTRDLDFLGFDNYPTFCMDPDARPMTQAFNLDRARGWTGNFLLLENQSGAGGSRLWGLDTPEPGETRLLSYTALARGGDGLLYFRWRTCRFGAEMYWRGILDHDDVPRRLYREIAQTGSELAKIGPELLDTSVTIRAAVAHCDMHVTDADRANFMGLPSPGNVGEWAHNWLYIAGHAAGCVHPEDDLTGLRLYIIPHWAYFESRVGSAAGGVGARGRHAGHRRPAPPPARAGTTSSPKPLPGCLRELAGVTVVDYGRQNAPEKRPLIMERQGRTFHTREWYEEAGSPNPGAEAFAAWTTRHLAGTPAVTLRRVGQGNVLYVGTYLTPGCCDFLLPDIARLAGLEPLLPQRARRPSKWCCGKARASSSGSCSTKRRASRCCRPCRPGWTW